ncbi:hypothetical protein G9464_20770 [Halostella sp. JP-L12]|uniref:hypothetical protein n=1 Tax=Halostella TaxID=1843185 RepID=UPI000EF829A7|nr:MULTISPECIES: hypothetical protein [Halostella]NHN50005.1 hypothetical protein [Halostella sp. JP-L12]
MNANEPQHDEYRFVTACKECGVTDDQWRTAEEVSSEIPTDPEKTPAYQHYDRTGHTVVEVNYTIAPYDVQKMLDDGSKEALDFERIAEAVSGNDGDEE